MQDNHSQFEQRKQDHIKLALLPANQACELNLLDQIQLTHEALPDFDFSDIDISAARFGKSVTTPFLISSMTAGHADGTAINRNLLEACARSGWAMGVGSQRRELFDREAAFEWQPLRRAFPDVSLFGNLGIAQLIQAPLSQIKQLIDSLQANALIIHCNPLQEVIQPEGTPQFKGCWQALAELVANIAVPVIVKETGCGFSKATLQRLNDLGVAAVDVSGAGGTHWGRIEGGRASHDQVRQQAAVTFKNWGISTLQSLRNAAAISPDFEVWGSGGVRHGLDAARLFALGATTVGFAKPVLEAALISAQEVYDFMISVEYELRVAMFCTGSRILSDLKEKACQ